MEKIIDEISNVFLENLEKANSEAKKSYVVSYHRKDDKSLIGYHASTFCQVTQNKFDAKRYHGDISDKQLEVITNNVSNVLKTEETDTGLFDPVKYKIKQAYFSGLTMEDIYVDAEYLDEDAPKQKFVMVNVGGE